MAVWDDETKERAKVLWLNQRFTAAQIGRQLGFSRSAVLGALHRMGVTGSRISPAEREARTSAARARKKMRDQRAAQASTIARRAKGELAPMIAKSPMPNLRFIVPEHPPLNLGIEQLTQMSCRWVTSEGYPATYCGHDVKGESSWCPFHHGIVYRRDPPDEHKRDAARDRFRFGALRVA